MNNQKMGILKFIFRIYSSKKQHQDLGKFKLEAYENKDLEKILVFKSILLITFNKSYNFRP